MGKITFGGKPSMASKAATVENRLGGTTGASKGSKPPPKATVKFKPMGGLKPHGVKVKIEKKF